MSDPEKRSDSQRRRRRRSKSKSGRGSDSEVEKNGKRKDLGTLFALLAVLLAGLALIVMGL